MNQIRIDKEMQAKQRLVPMYTIERVVDLDHGKKRIEKFIKRDLLCDGPNPTTDDWKRDWGWNLFDPSVIKANGDDERLKKLDPELYAKVFGGEDQEQFKPQDIKPQDPNETEQKKRGRPRKNADS